MKRDFTNARSNAARRGISWTLTFAEWAEVWLASGKYSARGRERGEYQMDRIDPTAGYHVGNVQIVPGEVNRTKDSPHGWVAILTETDVRAIRSAFRPRRVTMQDLADQYGVSKACIKAVLSRRNWKNVA